MERILEAWDFLESIFDNREDFNLHIGKHETRLILQKPVMKINFQYGHLNPLDIDVETFWEATTSTSQFFRTPKTCLQLMISHIEQQMETFRTSGLRLHDRSLKRIEIGRDYGK